MDSSKPGKVTDTQLRVTDFSTPAQPSRYIPQETLDEEQTFSPDLGKVYRIAWTTEGGFVARGLRSERFHEIIPISNTAGGRDGGEEECEVRTWECQGGVLARAVKWYFKDVLKSKFMEWCEDLKKECEKKVSGQGVRGGEKMVPEAGGPDRSSGSGEDERKEEERYRRIRDGEPLA